MSDFDVSAEDAEEAAAFEDKAREYFSEDRLEPALHEIDKALDLAPGGFDAWSLKAKILVGLGRGADALDAIEAALKLVPNDYDALAEKSGILSMFVGDLPAGLTVAREAYAAMTAAVSPADRANPDSEDFFAVESVYDNLYYALYKSGLTDEAEKIRTEAASFGHVFEAGIDDGQPDEMLTESVLPTSIEIPIERP